MLAFTQLSKALEEAARPEQKVAAMVRYFKSVAADDAAWAIYFLLGRRLKKSVSLAQFESLARESSGLPDWLYEASKDAVGDAAETAALILVEPDDTGHSALLSEWVVNRILPLARQPETDLAQSIRDSWAKLNADSKLIYNKLILGTFRITVQRELLVRAIAQSAGISSSAASVRLSSPWVPIAESFHALMEPESPAADLSRPYRFLNHEELSVEPACLGSIDQWRIDWKWGGMRAQLIRRQGNSFLWSSEERLVDGHFPGILAVCSQLPNGTVIDGEILCWVDGIVQPSSFELTEANLSQYRRNPKRALQFVLVATDLREHGGTDISSYPLADRMAALERLINCQLTQTTKGNVGDSPGLLFLPEIPVPDWGTLSSLRLESRSRGALGVVLRALNSASDGQNLTQRSFFWKREPRAIEAVLMYAERGAGREGTRFGSHTFGVWSEGSLIPIAKVSTGLTVEEEAEISHFVQANTVERFGPVRTVKPEIVVKLVFDSVSPSSRHKSGLVLKSPRIVQWTRELKPEMAATIEDVRAYLLNQ